MSVFKRSQSSKSGLFAGYLMMAGIVLMLFSGCYIEFGTPKKYTSFDEITIPPGFTFSTAREVTFNLTVRYLADKTIQNYDGTVSILTQDETGDTVFGSGLIVNGVGSFGVVIPTTVTRVVIQPDQIIMVVAEAELNPKTVSVTKTLAPPMDKSVLGSAGKLTASRAVYPKIEFGVTPTGFKTLSQTYNSDGVPTDPPEMGGLETDRFGFTRTFLLKIGQSLPSSQRLPLLRPEYIEKGKLSSVIIKEDAEVSIIFVSEGAGFKNSLGYYVTKTGDPVTIPKTSDIVIIFPNASALNSGGGLVGGDRIKLRNPVGDKNYGTALFTKGHTIHWVLVSSGFVSNTISASAVRYYSQPELNLEYKGVASDSAHAALLFYTDDYYKDVNDSTAITDDDAKLVLGIEDMNRAGVKGAGDEDFNDVLFVVTATPFKNIDISVLSPPIIASETLITEYFPATGNGTMIYEDRWPSKGDYDFNDMVVDFRMKTIRTDSGYVNSYRGDFVLKAAGASLRSGLGFVLPVKADTIDKVEYEFLTPDSSVFNVGANGIENRGTYVVIPVMDNAVNRFKSTIANTSMSQPTLPVIPVSVTITFKKDMVLSSAITGKTPDIFLVGSSDRSKEIHVLGKAPTDLAATGTFNTADDNSEPPLYYKDKKGAPWALMLTTPFTHTVESTELPAGYLHFGEWVVSGGTKYTDWYDKTGTGYVDVSRLYTDH